MKSSSVLVLVVVLLLTAPTVGAQAWTPDFRAGVDEAWVSVDEVYEMIKGPDGWEIYKNLNPAMREALWIKHMKRALVEMPDLSTRQRAVILQGLGLVESGALRVDRQSDDWPVFEESLKHLEASAKEAFDPPRGKAVFVRLGADVLMTGVDDALTIPNCACSQESDWCNWVTNPDPDCKSVLCREQNSGCGTFWVYPCDGICGAY
jgi:hypothetical protein